MTHPRFPHLLSPIQVGPRRLRCRVLVTAHEIRLGDDGMGRDGIVEWQQRQLEGLQVRIRLGHRVGSAEDLEGAETVVLAAGARPAPVSVEGAAEHGVTLCTAHDILDSEPLAVAPSLVWDRAGGGAAISAAEHLAVAGCRVVLVTPSMAVADDVDITNRVPLYRRRYEHSVTMLPNTDVARVDAEGVVVRNAYTGSESTISGLERVAVSDAARRTFGDPCSDNAHGFPLTKEVTAFVPVMSFRGKPSRVGDHPAVGGGTSEAFARLGRPSLSFPRSRGAGIH